jgi:hypothetical protein
MSEQQYYKSQTVDSQTIPVEFKPGNQVTLYRNDSREHSDKEVLFTGTVKRHVPETMLLEFEPEGRSEDVGMAKFKEYLHSCDEVRIQ